LLGLTWNEIDRKTSVIALKDGRDKTKVRQEIPIRTEALIALFKDLEADYKKLPNTDGLVLTCEGQRIGPMKLRRALQKACKATKISGFTFHDFRHCAITRWHAMNLPVSVAMRMAGHSSVQSHKKYVNLGTSSTCSPTVYRKILRIKNGLQTVDLFGVPDGI
jgi:integrase